MLPIICEFFNISATDNEYVQKSISSKRKISYGVRTKSIIFSPPAVIELSE